MDVVGREIQASELEICLVLVSGASKMCNMHRGHDDI